LIRDLAFLVRDALAPSKRVRIAGVLETQNIRNRYIPSIEKAKLELQLDLNYSLEQSILSAVEGR
jgi:dTDP-glucose 4,6-dehydratase